MIRRRLAMFTRERLLRARILPIPPGSTGDPESFERLYLVQQRKRLALAGSIGRFRPRNLPLFPLIGVIVLFRAFDLWIANQIIRSILNEHDLRRRIGAAQTPSGR